MTTINVCMCYFAVGGAEIFWSRLSKKLPQYKWLFTTEVKPEADVVVYSNDHKFYLQARNLNKPVIQRMTGPRSYTLPQPEDLAAVICTSQAGWEASSFDGKQLIYNGIDLEYLKTIQPIKCELLYSPARQGVGQCIDTAIQYAREQKQHLTVLGDRQHLAENTAKLLRTKYPDVAWPGLVAEPIALGYMKGCEAYVMPTPVAGVSNALIEAVAFGKPIINLGHAEIPFLTNIDLNQTASKYDELIRKVLNEGKRTV
jgi:glycosyltransferase involved in cell wall biosynthesis